jgi:hypothetical protein
MQAEIITIGDELLIGQVVIPIVPGWGKHLINTGLKSLELIQLVTMRKRLKINLQNV